MGCWSGVRMRAGLFLMMTKDVDGYESCLE